MNTTQDASPAAVAGQVDRPVRPDGGEIAETLERALRRAYYLGQTYWQQADSKSFAQNRLADETRRKFEALAKETSDSVIAHSRSCMEAERKRNADECRERARKLTQYERTAPVDQVTQARAARSALLDVAESVCLTR